MAGSGTGSVFKLGTTEIGEITSISGVSQEAGRIETTTLANQGYKTYIQGLKDSGDIEITGNFSFSDAGQTALWDAYDSGAEQAFTFEMTSVGAKWTGNCIVTKVSVEGFEVEGVIQFKASLTVVGKPTLAALA